MTLSRPAAFLTALALAGLACAPEVPAPAQLMPQLAFVDENSCVGCHRTQAEAWAGSHHDLAMQEAAEATVLGDFSGVTFEHQGMTSTFRRDGERFLVETEGPAGDLVEYEISAVFGVEPLQQYLIDFPDGRKQALGLAWDTRGRRWFHLYPDERIGPEDELHWTRRAQNWNWQCAECHATDLRRDWDESRAGYDTAAPRFDVGCQACHGPGSRHVASAESDELQPMPGQDAEGQVEACARCHSRRAPLGDGFTHGNRLMDDYLPALITEGLYHADGQILDEVYVYGSFIQSKMHAKGVRCSDCHDPHAATTRAPGNATCTVCHSTGGAGAGAHVDTSGLLRKDYDSSAHHFHEAGGPGSACVDCHAPTRSYMVVDPRHDHSFRVPRPDVSAKLGTPDACTSCHAEQDAEWAADVVAGWYGPDRRQERVPGESIHAGRQGLPGAASSLLDLIADEAEPAIFRATALELSTRYPSGAAVTAWRGSLGDADPLVRHAAIRALDPVPLETVRAWLEPLLGDPVRAVRMAAGRRLASLRPESRALKEWVGTQEALGGQPEALLSLSGLAAEQGREDEARRLMHEALELDPSFVPSALNTADLLSALGDEVAAERTLRAALERSPSASLLQHSLGLSLIRQGRHAEALAELGRAAQGSPEDPRLGYVFAVALHEAGQAPRARAELKRVLEATPWARDARLTLASWLAESVGQEQAREQLERLREINSWDPVFAQR